MYKIKYLDGSIKEFKTLIRADLQGANLLEANLQEANLREADLRWANLQWANLRGANLRGANLLEANLQEANLQGANLRGADLQGADLQRADLREADLQNTKTNYLTQGYFPVLNQGTIIVYKKVANCLVTMEVPENAKRSNATTRKCRVSKAKVISIVDMKDNKIDRITSYPIIGLPLTYVSGCMVYPDAFDENRWNECSNGIHCFATVEEALAWN